MLSLSGFAALLFPFLLLPQGTGERPVIIKERTSVRPWPSILGWASQDVLYEVVARRRDWYIIRFPTRSHPEALGKLRSDTLWEKEGGKKVRINSPRLFVLGADFPLRIGERYATVAEEKDRVKILYSLNGKEIPLWIPSSIVETPEEIAIREREEEERRKQEEEERRSRERKKKVKAPPRPPRPSPPPERLTLPLPEPTPAAPEPEPARPESTPAEPEPKGGEEPKEKKAVVLKEGEPLASTLRRRLPIVVAALVLALAVAILLLRKKRRAGVPRIDKTEKTLNRFYLKGRVLFREGKYKEAITEWEKALKIRPTHLEVKELIDKAERKIEERDKQLREIQERYFRGRRFFREGRYKETIDEWEQVLAYDLGSVNLQLLISEVKEKIEDMKTKEKEEPRKIKVQPLHKEEKEDYEEKIAVLQKEIEKRLGLSDDMEE